MKRFPLALLAAANLLLPIGLHAAAAPSHGHCMPATITAVPGSPGAFRVETARGSIVARRYPARPQTSAPTAFAEIRVFPESFDADGDSLGTLHDTIVVQPGTLVRWVRAGPGFHTVTNGADSGDPTAATEYSAIFDSATTSFEMTFTAPGRHDYFCFIHEPLMEGSIIVTTATADVGPPGVVRKAMFTRPPAPNPSRGGFAFAIALPRVSPVSLTVHDVSGRLVSQVFAGSLAAGEHPFRWDARGADGRRLSAGRYFIRLAAGATVETRAVSIVR